MSIRRAGLARLAAVADRRRCGAPASRRARAGARQRSRSTPGCAGGMLGPFRGGRVDAVSGVPGRPNEFYFGAVNGGVWKSIDAGRVWTPVFDSQPVASIGALAVAPSAPDTVYVGSGESTLRDSVGYGNGMYKSTDAGKTWTHIGLDDTQHIGKIAVDPKNPNVVFVAAIGHLYAANPERGVFRSQRRRQDVAEGAVQERRRRRGRSRDRSDELAASSTPALWNTRRPPWYTYAPTNGPGGGIFKSTDGGTTWKQLTNGLPTEGIGRTGIAIAPSNPRRVYAVVDCLPAGDPRRAGAAGPPAGGDGGAPRRRAASRAPRRRAASFAPTTPARRGRRCRATTRCGGAAGTSRSSRSIRRTPTSSTCRTSSVSRSKDGGKTWVPLRGSPGGDDYHQAWMSPDDSEHDDRRERSGRDHHAQREGRRPARR